MCIRDRFRMLYATGIRISEARNLQDTDVHLDENYLVIKGAKNMTDRIVPISQSLSNVCRQYVYYRERLPLKIDKKYFFLSLSGRKCGANHTIFRWFRLILKDAGIPFTGNHHGPRIHDLRHTFSLYAMEKMTREGSDTVSYTHLRAHETGRNLVCRLLLEKKKKKIHEKKKKNT